MEALVESPTLSDHLPLLQALSIDGMSSDEEEDLDGQVRGTDVAARNPRYRVLTPLWRSKELTVFLHLLDSIYLLQRRRNPSKQRGNWARVRAYSPTDLKFSKKTTFPKNLPENAYDKAWLDAFPNPMLSVHPAPRYNLAITAETLQYVSSQHRHTTLTFAV